MPTDVITKHSGNPSPARLRVHLGCPPPFNLVPTVGYALRLLAAHKILTSLSQRLHNSPYDAHFSEQNLKTPQKIALHHIFCAENLPLRRDSRSVSHSYTGALALKFMHISRAVLKLSNLLVAGKRLIPAPLIHEVFRAAPHESNATSASGRAKFAPISRRRDLDP